MAMGPRAASLPYGQVSKRRGQDVEPCVEAARMALPNHLLQVVCQMLQESCSSQISQARPMAAGTSAETAMLHLLLRLEHRET